MFVLLFVDRARFLQRRVERQSWIVWTSVLRSCHMKEHASLGVVHDVTWPSARAVESSKDAAVAVGDVLVTANSGIIKKGVA